MYSTYHVYPLKFFDANYITSCAQVGPTYKSRQTIYQKNLRRKTREDEVREDELALLEKRPRSTGSLVQNPHDDITTRIKNVEYIEMGKYRLKAS